MSTEQRLDIGLSSQKRTSMSLSGTQGSSHSKAKPLQRRGISIAPFPATVFSGEQTVSAAKAAPTSGVGTSLRTASQETLVGLLVAAVVVVSVSGVFLYQNWRLQELKLEKQAALHKSREWELQARQAQSELVIRAETIQQTGQELSRRSAELEKLRVKIERERDAAQKDHLDCEQTRVALQELSEKQGQLDIEMGQKQAELSLLREALVDAGIDPKSVHGGNGP